MMRLLRAEAARLLSRRFTVVALLVLLVGLVLFQIEVYRASRPPSAAEVAANRAQYEYSHQEWREDHEEYVQRCVEGGQTPQICASYYPEPQEEDFGLQAVPFSKIGSVAVPLAVYLSALALFLLAASYIGAEVTSGAIANWLSFLPRRGVFSSQSFSPSLFTAPDLSPATRQQPSACCSATCSSGSYETAFCERCRLGAATYPLERRRQHRRRPGQRASVPDPPGAADRTRAGDRVPRAHREPQFRAFLLGSGLDRRGGRLGVDLSPPRRQLRPASHATAVT